MEVPEFLTQRQGEDGYRNGQNGDPYQIPPLPEDKELPPPEKPVSKKQRNRVYGRVAYMFSAMFLALVGYMAYFQISLSDELKANPNNTKAEEQKQYVVRGSIYSADGEVLAGTDVDADGNETRIYPYGSTFAHVVGYTTNGKSGIEAMYNSDLLTSNTSIVDQVGKGVNNEKVRGDSLILTLDTRLQQAASTALGAYRGAVVVMEPDTGAVLAMVSHPDFDPNAMEEQWEYLIAEDAHSPLLNRATQGLYPPGSTFKILTALEYIQEHEAGNDYENYTFQCDGYITQNDVTIQCYDGEVHGYENLQQSFQHSCNTSFANIGLQLDLDKFGDLCEKFLFNGDLPTLMPYSSSQFVLNSNSSYGDIMTTSIGQGDTLVSPFHMALIVSTIANDGVMMYPYFVQRVENTEGVEVNETKPIEYKRIISAQEADILKSYMQSVVEGGTGSYLWNDSYTVAGKTGSAEYEVNGNTGQEAEYSTHSWFVGFSNVEDPDIVVSVIAEDGGTGSAAAVPIAKAVFDAYYNNQW
ncbi:penicillin-binding protein, transpeptidase domain protein [Marvinbryantia formatexigens DSM 14469]|uniref:Penicillin-binding protein, transpeptidase domain protein n=1 Tax=Marvinbryantia formatexigens DSM 14469 TaxID=478749 RepID=C6LER0_9FIRM|nr:penicillin-binding protein, transpeptidase domain protein [Marvinbryantia formatexigens DSM 14469]